MECMGIDDKKRRGESGVATVSQHAETFARTPVRGLRLLDASLHHVKLSQMPRFVIGRQATGVNWQIDTCPLISRRHCVLHVWEGKASIVRHSDASRPVLVHGCDIGHLRLLLSPWTFIQLGSKTILVLSDPGTQPDEVVLPAANDPGRALQAFVVAGTIVGAARLVGWSRNRLRDRLHKTATGRAMARMRPLGSRG